MIRFTGAPKRYHQVNSVHARPKPAYPRNAHTKKARRTHRGGRSRRDNGGRIDSVHTTEALLHSESKRPRGSRPSDRNVSRSVDMTTTRAFSSGLAPAYKTNGKTTVNHYDAVSSSDVSHRGEPSSPTATGDRRHSSLRGAFSSLVANGTRTSSSNIQQEQRPASSQEQQQQELELSARNLADVETFPSPPPPPALLPFPPAPLTLPSSRARARVRRSSTNPWDALTKGSSVMYASKGAASVPRGFAPILGEEEVRSRAGTISTIGTHGSSYTSIDELRRRPSLVSARYSPVRARSFDFPHADESSAHLGEGRTTQPSSFMSGSMVLNAARSFAYALFGRPTSSSSVTARRARAESFPSHSTGSPRSKASGSHLDTRRSSLDVSEFGFARDGIVSQHRVTSLPPMLESDDDEDDNFDNDGGSVCQDDTGRSFEQPFLEKRCSSVGNDHGFYDAPPSSSDCSALVKDSDTTRIASGVLPRVDSMRSRTAHAHSRSPSPDPRSCSVHSQSPSEHSRWLSNLSVSATNGEGSTSSTIVSQPLPNRTRVADASSADATKRGGSSSLPTAAELPDSARSALYPSGSSRKIVSNTINDVNSPQDIATRRRTLSDKSHDEGTRSRADTGVRPLRVSRAFLPSASSEKSTNGLHSHTADISPGALTSNVYLFPSP